MSDAYYKINYSNVKYSFSTTCDEAISTNHYITYKRLSFALENMSRKGKRKAFDGLDGRELTLPLQSALTHTSTKRTGVDSYERELLPRLELLIQIANENVGLLKAETIYKTYYDETQKEKAYSPGDLVWRDPSI